MKKVYLNVGLSENDSQALKSIVKKGFASSKTEFIRMALSNYLRNIKKTEVGRGILRHDKEGRITGFNKRYFMFSLDSFGFFIRNLKKRIGKEETQNFLFKAGIPAGTDAATKRQRETGTTTFEAMKKHAEMALTNGWGVAELNIEKEKKQINLIMRNYWESESHLEIFKEKSKEPVCSFFKGYVKGAADIDLGVDSKITEIKCIAKGDPYCEFKVNF